MENRTTATATTTKGALRKDGRREKNQSAKDRSWKFLIIEEGGGERVGRAPARSLKHEARLVGAGVSGGGPGVAPRALGRLRQWPQTRAAGE
jgi:hypothetical protein